MTKQILQFIQTGFALLIGYLGYFVGSFVVTVLAGLPIYLGIQYIITVVEWFKLNQF